MWPDGVVLRTRYAVQLIPTANALRVNTRRRTRLVVGIRTSAKRDHRVSIAGIPHPSGYAIVSPPLLPEVQPGRLLEVVLVPPVGVVQRGHELVV